MISNFAVSRGSLQEPRPQKSIKAMLKEQFADSVKFRRCRIVQTKHEPSDLFSFALRPPLLPQQKHKTPVKQKFDKAAKYRACSC